MLPSGLYALPPSEGAYDGIVFHAEEPDILHDVAPLLQIPYGRIELNFDIKPNGSKYVPADDLCFHLSRDSPPFLSRGQPRHALACPSRPYFSVRCRKARWKGKILAPLRPAAGYPAIGSRAGEAAWARAILPAPAHKVRGMKIEVILFKSKLCPYCRHAERELLPIVAEARRELGAEVKLRRLDVGEARSAELYEAFRRALLFDECVPITVVRMRGLAVSIEGYPRDYREQVRRAIGL